MNSFRKSILTLALVPGAILPLSAAEQNSVTFSYSDLQEEYAVWGTSGKEYYDVAIRLVQPELVGAKVRSFAVPMQATEGINEISVWMSKELTLVNKVNTPDIVSVPAEIVDDYIRVTFPEPYTITEEGVYVGYSFNVTETGTQATNKPVALTYGTNPDGFFIHTKRTYATWQDKSTSLGGVSMISVELEGDFPAVGASISCPAELNQNHQLESISIPVTLVNSGTAPITSLTFECDQNGEKTETTVEYAEAQTFQFARQYDLTVNFPSHLAEGMNYPTVRLTKINGEANPLAADASISFYSYTSAPKKRPIVEEYTGLWCGWCPRGYVALERMGEEETDFIGVAIHSGDDMQTITSSQFPSEAAGLPTAWVDRTRKIDPSYQNVKEAWTESADDFAYLSLTANALDMGEGEIIVDAEMNFVRPVSDRYAAFYYLLGNGLKSNKWAQTNYFSGKSIEDYPGMEQFIDAPEKVQGLTFNDVLLQASNPFGIEGSLPTPADIVPGETIKNRFTFDASKLGSCYSDFNLTGMAKSYSVVVGVVNLTTGAVANATKVMVGKVGVNTIAADSAEILSREYYDMQGLKASPLAKGMLIEIIRLKNGEILRNKVIRK